jgi:hypothetical protein
VYDQPRLLDKLRYAGVPENDVIELLFSLERNYRDDLPYCFLPVIDSESYNSNSYIGGLLRAARIPRPVTPGTFLFQYPGWLKPVPTSAFQSRDQTQ